MRAFFYVLFGARACRTNLVVDYAKVRIVVEDRRSAVGALGASCDSSGTHGRQVIALYALNTPDVPRGARGSGRSWRQAQEAPVYRCGPASSSRSSTSSRVWLLKLQFIASQIALFQANLAHASYTAAPVPVWPDSPAAEAIDDRSARSSTSTAD